jgi:succinyl-CoA synthetase beta subunit
MHRDGTSEGWRALDHGHAWALALELPGDLGCMANSARLANATMDITWLDGMFPASFIDVGGRSVAHDTIADGEIAANTVNIAVPLVVPVQGTTVDQGDAILIDLGLAVVPAHRPCDAVKALVVEVQRVA